jgi:MOSC domain-containing protein YiiM
VPGSAGGRPGRVQQVSVSNPGGVPKLPVERAWVGSLGLEGDAHRAGLHIHGGPDRAVCLYAIEAIERVAADGHQAFPGAYGENLTIGGLDWGSLRVGDVLEIGDDGLVIELTALTYPCKNNAHWFVDGQFSRISPKLFPQDARWYARVLTEGAVRRGDLVELVQGGS